ncbi:hypothetical protein KAT24_02845 [Candidatus Pacearchaeota archaeon]|nr:hypothetical protein [Candidatus Pacearchaeota archaeon]
MIVLDIESSGIDTGKCGIWQIGSIDLENPKNYFLEEGRVDYDDKIMEGALRITGKTKEDLLDKNKQSQKELILKWLKWVRSCEEKLFVGQNVGWDLNFIQNRCMRYDIMDEFRKSAGQRGMDLQTIAQTRYKEIHGKYLLKEDGHSDMNLKGVLNFCGIPDQRKQVDDGNVSKEGTPHNALEDCKLEGECYSRLEYGKNLFPEYSKYKIPEVLKK